VQVTIGVAHEVVAGARAGRMILLNGTSSSGKSSIAVELLNILDGAWFHLGVDGFHRVVAGMVAAGNDVVHQHGRYDVEVDTDRHTPAECATQIRNRLDQGPPTAFDQLRA
jgi:chloramphenicol 3-O-phosphotransferase